MQLCSTCNYQSPEGAKFCRQCGAPLYAENELSGADTRNYGRQDSAPPISAPLPARAPSVVDAFGPDTIRYQPAPGAAVGVGTSSLPNVGVPHPGMSNAGPGYYPAAPAYMPPVVQTAPMESKRRWRKGLKWAAAGFVLFIAAGIGAAINEESNDGRVYLSNDDRARLERLRTEDRLNRTLTGSIAEINARLREDLARQIEDIERAKEEALRAAERGSIGLDEKPLNLDEFEYPGSTSGQYSRVPGKELLTLRTKDDFETILRHYQAKLGKPYLTTTERNNRRALFQTAGTPSITVLVQETNDRNRDKISVLRSPFRFSKSPSELAGATGEAARPVTASEPEAVAKPAAPAPPASGKPAPQVPENR